MNKTLTNNGAIQYEHSMNHFVEFFSKAGSIRDKGKKAKPSFYSNTENIIELFKNVVFTDNVEMIFKLLFWLRNARGGAGNRSGFRKCMSYIIERYEDVIRANLDQIVNYGRWDDLRIFFGTKLESDVAKLWGTKILENDGLACKWADRSDKPLYNFAKANSKDIRNIGDFRRWLAKGRTMIPEQKMCSNNWNKIEYKTVPSRAMSLYTKAFGKHDSRRFETFKSKVEKGEEKINASVLFPHDCVLTARSGDKKIADLQFNALPNYMENSNERIMMLCDSSGSMSTQISGTTQAIDVSRALSLYCSDRLSKDNPFYRKFMEFESETRLTDWEGTSFSEMLNKFNGACGSTNIQKALDSLLAIGKMFKATSEQMPTILMIVSDMQFNAAVGSRGSDTVVNTCMNAWEAAGYKRPKIVYWNVAPHKGSPDIAHKKDVALISGFSPSILKAILSGEDFSPVGIMKRELEKYIVKGL
jgi:hypothetical protein